jgi:hypothetical protein
MLDTAGRAKSKPVKYDDVYGWNGKTVNKVWLSD